MVVLLLVTLSGTAFTGWLMVDPARQAMLPDLPQIFDTAHADDDGEGRESGGGGNSSKSCTKSSPT